MSAKLPTTLPVKSAKLFSFWGGGPLPDQFPSVFGVGLSSERLCPLIFTFWTPSECLALTTYNSPPISKSWFPRCFQLPLLPPAGYSHTAQSSVTADAVKLCRLLFVCFLLPIMPWWPFCSDVRSRTCRFRIITSTLAFVYESLFAN